MGDYLTFVPNPKMEYRRLGPSGLRVSALSLGGYLTLGSGASTKELIKIAFDNGINFIDTAEVYAKGQSEIDIGKAIKELKIRRSDLVIATKVFFGVREGPNATGLSRKHVIEGLNDSLERLQLDYVDVFFAHRPDRSVPMEEVVRAFNYCINTGKTHYWATSEWEAVDIEEAWHVADRLGLIGPIAEQSQHNLFTRKRPEADYLPIYEKYGINLTVWGALASGILTGKYNEGIPEDSRLNKFKTQEDWIPHVLQFLTTDEGKKRIDIVRQLTDLAKKELGCTPTLLALAFIFKQKSTGSLILGASSIQQLEEQLKVLEVAPKLTDEILEKIEAIVKTKPTLPTALR